MNLYQRLGVSREATAAEVKAAYRKLAKSNHPDVVGSDGSVMAEINEAYEVLSDPVKRAEYDATGDIPSNMRSIERQAEECIAQLFGKYLDEDGDFSGDLVGRLIEISIGIQLQHQSAIGRLKQHLLALERKQKRLRRKAGHDLFAAVAKQKMEDRRKELAKAENEAQVAGRMIELLREYSDTAPLKIEMTLNYGPTRTTGIILP